ncbi:MAG: hypothetical protein IJ443_03150 [Firmicutes bacterium]|nr:hypothetical protein [Bacillota bacterium]
MKEEYRQGLGEGSTFAAYHPAVNFIFFVLAIGITMFSMDPVFLAGEKAVKFNGTGTQRKVLGEL